MAIIVMDMEMNVIKREPSEIIEIGAVRLDDETLTIQDEFHTYVFPVQKKITPKTTQITGIVQADVEGAPLVEEALLAFAKWAGTEFSVIYSWSLNDIDQIVRECTQKGLDQTHLAYMYDHWKDFQKEFTELIGYDKPIKLQFALSALDLVQEGQQHAALDDARNTAFLYEASRNPKKAHLIDTIRDFLIPSSCTTSLADLIPKNGK